VTQATALTQSPFSPGTLEWGHPLLTPDGQTIRVLAFRKLRQLGALLGNSNRLSPIIHQLIKPEFDCISEELGRLLGANLNGPSWVLCTCKDCQRRAEESDHTALPGRNPLGEAYAEEIVKTVMARRKY
jgi:hypothetical protein